MIMIKRVFAILLVIAVFLSFLVVSVACSPTTEEVEELPEDIGEEMDMEDAVNMVVGDILPTIPEVQAGDPYWCIKLNDALAEGTSIEEDSGNTVRITLDQEKFFFYLDLAPYEGFAHDVKYILVDKNGNHEEHNASWWPLIDGEIPEELVLGIPGETDVIATNFPTTRPTGTSPTYDFPILGLERCEGFLIVLGTHYLQSYHEVCESSYFDALAFFTSYAEGNECSVVKGLYSYYFAGRVLAEIDEMANDHLNPITILIIAHGNVDGISCGGEWITASEFADTLAAHPYTTFNVMLCSCRSGSFIDDLSTLDNVCVVATAVASEQLAMFGDVDEKWGLTDFNPEDVGNEWISSILKAMSDVVWDVYKWSLIEEMASELGVPVTSVLINVGQCGAIGHYPPFDLTQDLDISHRLGIEPSTIAPRPHDPQLYVSYWPPPCVVPQPGRTTG